MTFKKAGGLVALGAAVLLGVTACSAGAAASGSSASSSAATSASLLSPSSSDSVTAGVKVDPAAVKLLPASVKKQGELTVAMDLAYPPTSFLASDNATAIGFNPDIARLLGKKLGLKIQIENVSFDTIIPGIAGGRYSFTATDMSPTPARLQVLDMINYWNAGSSLLVSTGNPLKLSFTNNSLCGKSIAVTTGSTEQLTYLPSLSTACTAAGKAAINAVILPNVQAAITQLSSKRVSGVFYDTSSLGWAATQQPKSFELLAPQFKNPTGSDLVAIGLAKDSPLTPAMHVAMQSVIDSPQYKEALSRWGLGAGAITSAKLD